VKAPRSCPKSSLLELGAVQSDEGASGAGRPSMELGSEDALSHACLARNKDIDPALGDAVGHLAESFHCRADRPSSRSAKSLTAPCARRFGLGRCGCAHLAKDARISQLEDISLLQKALLSSTKRPPHQPGPGGAPQILEEHMRRDVEAAVASRDACILDHQVAAFAASEDDPPPLRQAQLPALLPGKPEENGWTTGTPLVVVVAQCFFATIAAVTVGLVSLSLLLLLLHRHPPAWAGVRIQGCAVRTLERVHFSHPRLRKRRPRRVNPPAARPATSVPTTAFAPASKKPRAKLRTPSPRRTAPTELSQAARITTFPRRLRAAISATVSRPSSRFSEGARRTADRSGAVSSAAA
jgi:hypothetical protein